MKYRLTGAAILAVLIVLLVPELLHGPSRPVTHPVAASDGAPPFRTVDINVADDAHAHGVATPPANGPQQPAPIPSGEPAAQPVEAAAEPAAVKAAPTPTPAPAPTPAVTEHPAAAQASAPPVAAPVPDATAAGGAFLVQLGSFASRDNADRLAKQVKSQGYTVSVVRGSTGRHLYKVLVGPAHDHAGATQLEAKLRSAGHPGTVVAK